MVFTRLGKQPQNQQPVPQQYTYQVPQPQVQTMPQQEISENLCSVTISGSESYVEEMLKRLNRK